MSESGLPAQADWWLEEHGLIMERPTALPPGQYKVTGDREVTTTLTVYPKARFRSTNGAESYRGAPKLG